MFVFVCLCFALFRLIVSWGTSGRFGRILIGRFIPRILLEGTV